MTTSDMPPTFHGMETIVVHALARKGENGLLVSIKNEIVERVKVKIAERNVMLVVFNFKIFFLSYVPA